MNFNNLTKVITLGKSARSYHNTIIRAIRASMSAATYKGLPISEIRGSENIWAHEFPAVAISDNHVVLYSISSNDMSNRDSPPIPYEGKDQWNQNFVRLPCSPESKYTGKDNNGRTVTLRRWDKITEALRKPINNSTDLMNAILSYNPKYENKWKFDSLHTLCNEHMTADEHEFFFKKTLPDIAKLALRLPDLVKAPIPLLKQNDNMSVSLTQEQISCLLANAFFCTFPLRNSTDKKSEYDTYPHINFNRLYDVGNDDVLEKLKCICHYFRRVCQTVPRGVLTLSRRAVRQEGMPRWDRSDAGLGSVPLHVDPGLVIERAEGLIQLDFANKYLGGGVLGHGTVQEEIRFSICPELLISLLITEVLDKNEALFMIGAERYSKHMGYSRNFQWMGDYRDDTPFDRSGRRRTAVLAIDAMPFHHKRDEYKIKNLERELNKAWVGFSFYARNVALNYPGVATGNWGCGAFGGSPQLKSLLQLMACAEARRPMAYVTYGDTKFAEDLIRMYNALDKNNVTVRQLYQHILNFAREDSELTELYKYLHRVVNESNNDHHRDVRSVDRKVEKSDQTRTQLYSPDIFSQPEDDSQPEMDTIRNKSTDRPNHSQHRGENHSTKHQQKSVNKMTDSDIEMLFIDDVITNEMETPKIEMTDSGTNVSETIMAETNTKTKMKDTETEMAVCNNGMAETNEIAVKKIKMADAENKTSQTSRLFDVMQRFDEDNGRLNLSVSHKTPGKQRRILNDSDASMDDEKGTSSKAVKKKIAKKITDYYSKKPV